MKTIEQLHDELNREGFPGYTTEIIIEEELSSIEIVVLGDGMIAYRYGEETISFGWEIGIAEDAMQLAKEMQDD